MPREGRVTPAMAIGLAATITLLIAPYTWPYDQLLLLPALVLAIVCQIKAKKKKLAAFWLLPVVDVVAIVLALTQLDAQTPREFQMVGLPLLVLGLIRGVRCEIAATSYPTQGARQGSRQEGDQERCTQGDDDTKGGPFFAARFLVYGDDGGGAGVMQ